MGESNDGPLMGPASGAAPFMPVRTAVCGAFLRAHAWEITAPTRRRWLPFMLLIAVPYACAVSDAMCLDSLPMTVTNSSGEQVAVTPYFHDRDGRPSSLIVHGLHRRAIAIAPGATVELRPETGDYRFAGMLLHFARAGDRLLLPGDTAAKVHAEIHIGAPDRYAPAPAHLATDLGLWRTYRATALGFIAFVLIPSLTPALFSMVRAYKRARARELDVIRARGVAAHISG